MKKSSTEIANEYITIATLEGEAKLTGNYRYGNRLAKKLNKITAEISTDSVFAESVITEVLSSSSDRARALISTDALRLGLCTEKALTTLEEISHRPDIIGFGSKMSLMIWRGEVSGKTL